MSTAPTEWPITVKAGSRIIRARAASHHIDFEISRPDNENEIHFSAEFRGSLKWDGCINWETTPNYLAHLCRLEDLDDVKLAFVAVWELGPLHLETWYG